MLTFWLIIKLFFFIKTTRGILLETEQNSGVQTNPSSCMDTTEDTKQHAEIEFPACPDIPSAGFPLDCADIIQARYVRSGVAKIWPRSRAIEYAPFLVYCDMETDGGGWTVIQRRGQFLRPNDYFFRKWDDYKEGFGNIEEDFWLGNDNIFALTSQRLYSLRFDLKDVEGEHRYAMYENFWIDGEENGYMLHVKGYSGDAGDSFTYHNGQKFSTEDKDSDVSDGNCAKYYKGAWWYRACHDSNLNGMYYYGKHETKGDSVSWFNWKGNAESLATTEMKIRPRNFVNNPLEN